MSVWLYPHLRDVKDIEGDGIVCVAFSWYDDEDHGGDEFPEWIKLLSLESINVPDATTPQDTALNYGVGVLPHGALIGGTGVEGRWGYMPVKLLVLGVREDMVSYCKLNESPVKQDGYCLYQVVSANRNSELGMFLETAYPELEFNFEQVVSD